MSTELQDALSQLESLAETHELSGESMALFAAMKSLLTAVGQCEIEEPFSPLHPILTQDGLFWCCEHDPRHCSGRID